MHFTFVTPRRVVHASIGTSFPEKLSWIEVDIDKMVLVPILWLHFGNNTPKYIGVSSSCIVISNFDTFALRDFLSLKTRACGRVARARHLWLWSCWNTDIMRRRGDPRGPSSLAFIRHTCRASLKWNYCSQIKIAGCQRRGASPERVAQHAAHARHARATSLPQPPRHTSLQRHR